MSAVFRTAGRIATVEVDNPPVNALSQPVRQALVDAVRRAEGDDQIDALVIACAGRTFFAGADIREFGQTPAEPYLTTVVDAIEACSKPIVAAIHGTALGGGLEIAMACHYRIAVASARLGLPEVKLGLMPGARGTVRLPRLVGVDRALAMISSGDPMGALDARDAGLVDRIVQGDLEAEAEIFARNVADAPVPRTRDRDIAPTDPAVFDNFLQANARKFRGLDAPVAIQRAIRNAVELSFDDAAALERDAFLGLQAGRQSKALRHVFFAERETAKVPAIDGIPARAVRSVSVVGGGTMGRGICLALLSAGFAVTLVEQDDEKRDAAVAAIDTALDGEVRRGRIDEDERIVRLGRLASGISDDALADADLIIEAAFETMDVKRAIFERLDRVAKPGAILATNTSYLDVDAIAATTRRPQDVLGLHFFSPANIMKLVEVVHAKATAPDVLASGFAVAKAMGKTPVLAANGPGFIGNRMLAVRRRESERMVEAGVSPYDIDRVAEAFGFPMGPFRIGDLSGLDLGWSAETSTGSTIRECLNEAGRRGQKVGAGFYDYDGAGIAQQSEAALAIIARFAADKGHSAEWLGDEDILARLLWPMVDEGYRLLDEGIAQRESDIDIVWLLGYGWPRWTGGPMYHAATTGLEHVSHSLREAGLAPSEALLRRIPTIPSEE